MTRWPCDDMTVGTGRECGARSQPGGAAIPRTRSTPRVPPPRGDVTAVSPRLSSGALLALTVAMTAAAAVVTALPALAGPAASGRPAAAHAAAVSETGSDRVRTQEWWLDNLHVPRAWPFSRGAGVTVAVLSSGVETTHPDLAGSVVTGPDLTGSDETAGVPSWDIEGTSAASIIAGNGDSAGQASGIIGIAPAARILSLRVVLDATDPLNANPADVRRLPAAIGAGIRYAARHGAQVIDLPLDPASLASDGAATGGLSAAAGGSAAERAAVSDALGKGAVLVAPAGDSGEDGNGPTYPASYPGVIAVGAVDRHFVRAPFSIRQPYVALTAPGVNLTTASPPSGYRNMSTTDAASAVVAGVAALIRSRYPALTGSQVRQALLADSVARPPSATTAGDGAGTVDALKAVQAAAVIAAPHASALAPSTSPATAPTPRGKTRPAAGHPATGILGRAKAVLRDAAMAAGMLIVLLLASLLGIRVRRRRTERVTLPASEPRTLLSAPSGPLAAAGGARHTKAAAEGHAIVAHDARPGAGPWRADPARPDWPSPPRGQDRQTRVHPPAHGTTAGAVTRPPWPGAPQALASGPAPRILPVPGAPPFPGAFPGPSSPGLPGRPGTSGPARSSSQVPGGPLSGGALSGGAVPGGAVPSGAVPGAAMPGGRRRRKMRNRGRGDGRYGASSQISAHGLRVRVSPVPRTVTRAEVTAPGGPPWEPAPMPEGEVPHEPGRRAPDPFALFVPPAPATSAPWDVAQPGQATGPRPIAPSGYTPAPGHVAWSGRIPPQSQIAPPGIPAPMAPPRPGPPHRRGQFGPGTDTPGANVPGTDLPGPGRGWSGPGAGGMAPLPPTPGGLAGPMPPARLPGPLPSAGPAMGMPVGPMPPAGRLRSGGPAPPADPAFPGGEVPGGPAMPGSPASLDGRLPLVRPSSFAGSSGPPEPPRPANPSIPPPAGPEPATAASGQPGEPDLAASTVPGAAPPSGAPGSGAPRWRRSPYSGRHASDTGPQPVSPGPAEDPGSSPGQRPGEAPSSPLHSWNPAALTEPFPAGSPSPPGEAGHPGEKTADPGDPAP